MIALLNYSINSSSNDNIPFTGEEESDSTLIAYSDLKIVNSKLIELEYEKEINTKLISIIKLDSLVIDTLLFNNNLLYNKNIELIDRQSKLKKQRNTAIGVGVISLIIAIMALVK